MTTATLTYGVCVDGAMPDDSFEFDNPTAAIAAAEKIKLADTDALVTICLWA